MGAPVPVKNATDTYVNKAAPQKNYGQKARIWLRGGTTGTKQGLIYFAKPWTPGCTIQQGIMSLWNDKAITGTVSITIQRLGSKWDVNKAKWGSSGFVGTGATVVVTKTNPAANTRWDFDVAALLQTVANGANWYGFLITSNITTDHSFYSTQAGKGDQRPIMSVTWNDPPDLADDLIPRDGAQVSVQYPTLQYDFNDIQGDSDLVAQRIQFGASTALLDAGTTTFDSGEVATTVPEFVSNQATPGGTWAGLANAATTAWRVFTKDSGGAWSQPSPAVLFGRTNKGTLTIVTPTASGIFDGSPTVSWTYTGQTQRAYQVAIAKASDPLNWLWDSGKVTSTDTSTAIPFGVIDDASVPYIIIVRVWDTINRMATPGDPVFSEATVTASVAYDATVANVTSLAASSDPLLPIEHITFVDATAPDSYQLQRSDDGGTTWRYIKEVLPAEVNTGGTNYMIDDNNAAQYTAYNWRVLRVVAGRQGGPTTIPNVSGQVRKLAPFLVRKNGSDAVCFLNPKRERARNDQQGVFETQGGTIVVTQRLGGNTGSVEGRFTADSMAGVTAKQQKQRFERFRDDAGQEFVLYIGDESFNVVTLNMEIDSIIDINGITYLASFDWIEVPKS